MHFYIGISVNNSIPTDIVAAGVAWSRGLKPAIAGQSVPMRCIKDSMPAVAVVRGESEITLVNALCNRIAEKLLLKGYFASLSSQNPHVQLLLRHRDVRGSYLFPVKKTNNHWLLNLSDEALIAWLRGDR